MYSERERVRKRESILSSTLSLITHPGGFGTGGDTAARYCTRCPASCFHDRMSAAETRVTSLAICGPLTCVYPTVNQLNLISTSISDDGVCYSILFYRVASLQYHSTELCRYPKLRYQCSQNQRLQPVLKHISMFQNEESAG